MHCVFVSVDETIRMKSAICEIFCVGLALKHSAMELYLIIMLRFQGIQSKFSFKLYILNSERFHAVSF